MELTNEFDVAVPVEVAWSVLTDLERIAPCLPGAQLREIEGDEYRGVVKVKVGPITTSYDGTIRVTESDEIEHRITLKAEGRETRGQGNVAATFSAAMSTSEIGTHVVVTTDLAITGKAAQFGRGVLANVSAKLLDQFVANLETQVLAPLQPNGTTAEGASSPSKDAAANPTNAATKTSDGADVPSSQESSSDGVRQINSAPPEPMDVFEFMGLSSLRRFAKPAGIAALILLALRMTRRR